MEKNIGKTDPVCGMKGSIKAHGHYFCSENCIRKYEKAHKIPESRCYECEHEVRKWFNVRLYQVSALIALFLVTALLLNIFKITFLNAAVSAFWDYTKLIWWAILLGLFLGGVIDYFVPRKYISKYLAGGKRANILYAVMLGFLMSACSHGILAISIELYKKGASIPAVIAFLLASPWANLTITIVLFGFFGVKALFFVISAIIIAIITGLIFQMLESRKIIEQSRYIVKVEKGFSIRKDFMKRWHSEITKERMPVHLIGVARGSWALAKMVLWWILIGMIIASFARAYVPAHFFHLYLGPTILGLVVTLVLATIIEVCSEGSAPIAFEIFRQTLAFGNAFVFLMAGVVTDYTEIGLVWSNIGRKTAIWLPIVAVPQVIILGILFNILL
jgi:hypothetical protein